MWMTWLSLTCAKMSAQTRCNCFSVYDISTAISFDCSALSHYSTRGTAPCVLFQASCVCLAGFQSGYYHSSKILAIRGDVDHVILNGLAQLFSSGVGSMAKGARINGHRFSGEIGANDLSPFGPPTKAIKLLKPQGVLEFPGIKATRI